MAVDRCISCGDIIPEGRYVCAKCENTASTSSANVESVIVAYDSTHGVDKALLLIGKKKPRRAIEVINAIAGKDAAELWTRLTVKKMSE